MNKFSLYNPHTLEKYQQFNLISLLSYLQYVYMTIKHTTFFVSWISLVNKSASLSLSMSLHRLFSPETTIENNNHYTIVV